MCPKDFYITSLMMKYEKKQNTKSGDGDDTATNGFAFVCRPMIGKDKFCRWKSSVKKVVANGQKWGDWKKPSAEIMGSYVCGGQVRSEKPRNKNGKD